MSGGRTVFAAVAGLLVLLVVWSSARSSQECNCTEIQAWFQRNNITLTPEERARLFPGSCPATAETGWRAWWHIGVTGEETETQTKHWWSEAGENTTESNETETTVTHHWWRWGQGSGETSGGFGNETTTTTWEMTKSGFGSFGAMLRDVATTVVRRFGMVTSTVYTWTATTVTVVSVVTTGAVTWVFEGLTYVVTTVVTSCVLVITVCFGFLVDLNWFAILVGLIIVLVAILGAAIVIGPTSYVRFCQALIGSTIGGLMVGACYQYYTTPPGFLFIDSVLYLAHFQSGSTNAYVIWLAFVVLGLLRWWTRFECGIYDVVEEVNMESSTAQLSRPLMEAEAPAV